MIELVFFTSSRIKLAHARYLCRDYAVRVVGFREKTFGANYDEPRIYDRDQLIELSYQDAFLRWQKVASKDRIFFIEDTSVSIDALSDERETPGLDVKYWMKDTNFQQLDDLLKASGNNRRVTVRSDLVLHLSSDISGKENKGYKCFTSMVTGTVVEQEDAFDTNPMYPWLDNKTFNKWFVPESCSKPISMLPILEADKHDFRAEAFREMLEFLESHQKIFRRTQQRVQASFGFGPRLFIVSGPSCSGKSTLADYLAGKYRYCHIEASDFMHLSYYQRHGVSSAVDIGDFAAQALKEQPEIVAEQVLDYIQSNKPMPLIITGFRSPVEIDWFTHYYIGEFSIEVIYVTADEAIRYARSLSRQREGDADTKKEFTRRDIQQSLMGLAELEKRFTSNRIENNDSLEKYFEVFEAKYALETHQLSIENATRNLVESGKLEESILLALEGKWQSHEYFTTTEIAQLINQYPNGKPKNKNNVSRYFNQTFHPFYEVKLIDGKRKYRLSNTGYGKARMLRNRG